MATIDNLTLELTADGTKAVRALNEMATAMGNLKDKLPTQGKLEGASKGFKALADEISKLSLSAKNLDKIKAIGTIANNLNKLNDVKTSVIARTASGIDALSKSVSGLSYESILKVEKLSKALSYLPEKVSISGIKKVANASNEPATSGTSNAVSQSMNSASQSAIMASISLDKFWSKFQYIQNGVKGNPISLFADAEDSKKMEKLGESLGLSTELATSLTKELGKVGIALKGAGVAFTVVSSAISLVSNQIKKITEPFTSLLRSLYRIALYRAIRSAIKAISQALREGTQNLALYSKGLEGLDAHNANEVLSRYASAFLYVKNAIATAVMPVLRALIPLVEQAMFRLVDFINVISQVGSAFFGTDFTKAKYFWVDYADSLDNANGRAKALHHQLAQFDELNNLTAPSGGSGSDKVKDALDMFEEAKIDSKIQGFVDKIKNAFNTVKEMFAPVKKIADKAKELFSLSWEKVSPNLKRIWDSIKKIWNQTLKPFITGFIDGFVDGFLMTDAFQSLPDLLGWISDKVADVAEAFAKWKTRIDPELMEKFGKALGVVSGWIVGLIADSTTVGDRFKDFKDKVKKLKDYLADLFRPELENLKNNLDALKGVVDLVIEKFWNFINPVSSLKGMIEQLKDAYKKFQDKCDDVNQKIAESDGWFKKLLDKVIEVKDWFAQNNLFAKLQSNTSDSNDKLTTLKDTIQKVKDKAVEVKDWFTNTELFKKAIENANNFKSVLETIKNILDGLKNFSANIGFNWNSTGDDGGTGAKDTVGSGSTGGGNTGGVKKTETTTKDKTETGKTGGKDLTGGRQQTGKTTTTTNGNYGGYGSLQEYLQAQKKKATGGFVPRGDLFIANEKTPEMIGSIGGNTAVANNNQITEAIATATYNAMARALSENGQNVNVVVEADGDRMFKVFQKKQRDWQRTTGLAY